jgi:hypothetical protein
MLRRSIFKVMAAAGFAHLSKSALATSRAEPEHGSVVLPDYRALRAYVGNANSIGILNAETAGHFERIILGAASSDNGGTLICDGLGRGWLRDFDGDIDLSWFIGGGMRPSEALSTAIEILSEPGGVIRVPSGVHDWSRVPRIPAGMKKTLSIVGINMPTIMLSSEAPRFLDFSSEAKPQIFGNLLIEGLEINGNGIGGKHHVIIGTYVDGKRDSQLSVQNLQLRNIRGINVPTDSSLKNHRGWIWIEPFNSDENYSHFLKSITIENVQLQGGNGGIAIAANGNAGYSNTWIDDVHIENCSHRAYGSATNYFPSSNLQIGQDADVGRITIKKFFGENSGDDGIEINNCDEAWVEECTIKNPNNMGYFANNFHDIGDRLKKQKITYMRCNGVFDIPAVNGGDMWRIGRDYPIGEINLVDCNTTIVGNFQRAGRAIHTQMGQGKKDPSVLSFNVKNFAVDWTGNATETDKVCFPSPFLFGFRGKSILKLENVSVIIRGSPSINAQIRFQPRIFQISGENVTIDIRGIKVTYDLTPIGNLGDELLIFNIGENANYKSVISGEITDVNFNSSERGLRVCGIFFSPFATPLNKNNQISASNFDISTADRKDIFTNLKLDMQDKKLLTFKNIKF